ncbi:MAG: Isocitrate lyase [Candidatus Heimdallarchaeota archaeon LC_2]|nr:MAG: Isocitrate lyase [Candidatus Heimdallarchaeota archaeon LC_2]
MRKTESKNEYLERIKAEWENDPRWIGITRLYSAEQVWKLKGSINKCFTLAEIGAEKLWNYIQTEPYINTLGALTGNQALQIVSAGLKAIYVSGWQVAADMNEAGEMYPDQSLYPADSAPKLVRRINNALLRADQIQHMDEKSEIDYFQPIVADGEAGFGGPLNVFEFMKAMIKAGAAGVHFEDQLSSYKKCGHLGGKVLVPTSQFIQTLIAARLASDVMEVPTLVIARTDAESANLLMSDVDPLDREFIMGDRSPEGFYYVSGGLDAAIKRSLAYAPYCDLLWFETKTPDLEEAESFAKAIHEIFPGKPLAYNCSPSFNWSKKLGMDEIETFQKDLGKLGYKFQFVTLAGFHDNNYGMFKLARKYAETGMRGYVELQNKEFDAEKKYGFKAVKHQTFVGAGYFDEIALTISSGNSSTTALKNSTEEIQFSS